MRTKPPTNGSTPQKPDRTAIGRPPPREPDFPIQRTVFYLDGVCIYGWPSRGGLIVLPHATTPDFRFLGWDVIDPPMKRDKDQDAEDQVCQKLLLLGAHWFDSKEGYGSVVADAEGTPEPDALSPTMSERSWIRVGWPSEGGGLWVAEYDDPVFGMSPWPERRKEQYLVPNGAGQLDYDGTGCLRAWEEKHTGEVGPLVATSFVEW
ncbi:hypothetical protein BDW62DRAFT_211989 [Aspergillus aurantiobrunneus]